MSLTEDREQYFRDWQMGLETVEFNICANAQFYLLNTIHHDTALYQELSDVIGKARKYYDNKQTELDNKKNLSVKLSEKQELENQIIGLEITFWKEMFTIYYQKFLSGRLINDK